MKSLNLCCLSCSLYYCAFLLLVCESPRHMTAIISAFLVGLFLPIARLRTRLKGVFRRLHMAYLCLFFFINTGLSANVRQLPIDGLGLKMDMFFVREFPLLLLIFLVFILVLILWRLLIIYATRGYNIQMGWRNDLLILCLGLIT